MASKSSRERMLEKQVAMFADRLAITAAVLHDMELTAFCEDDTLGEEYCRRIRKAVTTEAPEWDKVRNHWRDNAFYEKFLHDLRELLRTRIKAAA